MDSLFICLVCSRPHLSESAFRSGARRPILFEIKTLELILRKESSALLAPLIRLLAQKCQLRSRMQLHTVPLTRTPSKMHIMNSKNYS